ncbi:MAG: hypothetical protein JNL63_05080 [Bacteroidia bacterium]|nr:hypothetical protein [Bacteroidia bacterium]
MSKIYNDPLFRLIRSLTKSEKRYFKLYVSRHLIKEASHYITLFNAIEKQDNYSKKNIYKELSDIIKNIPSTKYHLYQKILESLELFYQGKQIDSIITQGITHSAILLNKSLPEEAYYKLQKTKKIAYANEKFELILNIIQLERRILLKNFLGQKELNSRIEKILKEEKSIFHILSRENEYKHLAYQVDMYIKKRGMELRSAEEKKIFKQIIQHPIMKDENSATTLYSKRLMYYILQNYYLLVSDLTKAKEYSIKNLIITETGLSRGNKQDLIQYIYALNNLLVIQLNLKDYTGTLNTIKKLKLIPAAFKLKETSEEFIKVIEFGYIHEIALYNNTGHFDKAATAGKLLTPEFNKVKNKISQEYFLVFYSNMASANFGINRYKESLHWINELFNLPREMFREDIMVSMKILNLINNFELKNYDHLEYMNLAAQRYFKKQKKVYKIEFLIVSFIQKYAKINTNEELNEFKKLRVKITNALKSPYERTALDPLDIISWIDSKIQNRPFAEVVKEKKP